MESGAMEGFFDEDRLVIGIDCRLDLSSFIYICIGNGEKTNFGEYQSI